MLVVPFRPQFETLQARPIVSATANAWEGRRVSHAGGSVQDVVRGVEAEIIAEPKLVAAQAKMDVVAAGAANASGETEADGSPANGARPAAKAVAHASVATARAEAEIQASVTAAAKTNAVSAAAKAKTNAAVTGAADRS